MVPHILLTACVAQALLQRRRLAATALAVAALGAASAGASGIAPVGAGAPGQAPAVQLAQAAEESIVGRLPRPRPPAKPPAQEASAESPTVDAESGGPPPPDEPAKPDPVVETGTSAGASSAPFPRPRPALTAAAAARLAARQLHGFMPDLLLKASLDAINAGRYADARELASKHEDALAGALVDWIVARQQDSGMSAADIVKVLESHVGWPEPERLFLRAEQAFHALGPDGQSVLAFYSATPPRTVGGQLALAGALLETGRAKEAHSIARTLWREWPLASNQALALLTRFGDALQEEDHLFRFRRLVLRGRTSDAVAQAKILGAGYDNLAKAVIAVLDRKSEASALLRAAAPKFFAEPLYDFARIRLLRRAGQPLEAARILMSARPDRDAAGDADIWWDERRDLSRELLDRGTPDLAYRVVAEADPVGEGEQVEAAFHRGWYALRFLHDADLAEPHFRELHTLATLPRSQARASYWLGRTHEALGREAAARLDYVEGARFGGTYYGQLARQRIGLATTGLERIPRPSAMDRLRFEGRDAVRVIRLLAAAGYSERAFPFIETVAESVDSPGEVALLTNLARRIGLPHAGTRAAAVAEERGLPVGGLAAPFFGVPRQLPMPETVDRALVYAVVRQESAFNHQAVSHAGARGLMQLMPATAKATASSVQMPFSVQRLTTDPLYNATLGAHHLSELLDGLKRSYVLTFVGYNAGPGRALQWIKSYGDPRGGETDPVDWIERIPFDETRDYVQKVMENLQVYRSRTGYPLSLSADLVRGGPQG